MDLVLDFLLLAASGTACFYCWNLNNRLKGLTSTKDGFGAGVAALSQSAAEMKTAMAETKSASDQAVIRLESMLEEADNKVLQLQEQIEQLRDISNSVVGETESATRKYVDTLTPFITEATEVANRLFEALESAPVPEPTDKGSVVEIDDAPRVAPASRKKAAGAGK